ncbi:alpha-1-macroglobulin-like [Homarus americanus]|uniref:alpha-1-macroglobulin-like n=1 Tax=Homarus americanus TaxID=6706 RepID=UPI001C486F12|nr:alpha-1-macroglobulin-like [Homarus americanus]
MAATSPPMILQISVVAVLVSVCCSHYIVTTPRKWTPGETVQVCVFTFNSTSPDNVITAGVTNKRGDKSIVPTRTISLPPGKTELCDRVIVPVMKRNRGFLKITGHLGGKNVSYEKKIKFANPIVKTFIQTDKFLYKPEQDVQFRVLTLMGPFLKVSTDKYPHVWVENPSGSRIAQWTDVDNRAGLIHLSLRLTDEPEEGTYMIHASPPGNGKPVIRTFKVEAYVLPRFQVTVTPPSYILGSDEKFNVTVCAKYTYGQPVKGNVTLNIKSQNNRRRDVLKLRSDFMAKPGCKSIEVFSGFLIPGPYDVMLSKLVLIAVVVEDGTGLEMSGETEAVVHRKAITFTSVGREKFRKPNLPFTGRVKATFPDGSPAGGEPMTVCVSTTCKTILTPSDGILEFITSTADTVVIKSNRYQAIRMPALRSFDYVESPLYRYRDIMSESKYIYSVDNMKSYFSPSQSSLIIYAPAGHLACQTGDSREHVIQVLYAAVNQARANVTVQVVSRGQIQYSNTKEYELLMTSLPLDEGRLVEPLPPPPSNIVRGFIEIPISILPTVSPLAKVVVWYIRHDGEVVSDVKELEIHKCYNNKVDLAWSHSRVQPGEDVNVNLSAEPQSLCSLGVVDKSVELLSSQNDDLTVDEIFKIVENSMILEWENAQSDDTKYCQRQAEQGSSGEPWAHRGEFGSVRNRFYWNFPSTTNHVDAMKMFDKSGLYFFSDLTTETRPCTSRMSFSRDITGQADLLFSEEMPERFEILQSVDQDKFQTARKYFPETWLWKLSLIGSSGVSSEPVTVPDTITEWVGKAVCIHPEKGLGISEEASITVFTPFFIDLTLPPSVKRGELLPVKVSIFNFLQEDLPVKVVLEDSSEYVIESHGVHSDCIPSEDKKVHTVKIRSLVHGDVNITVRAFVDELYPEVCGSEYVISKRDVVIKPIKVEVEGFPVENTWTKYICSTDIEENLDYLEIWKIELPPGIVSDSTRGWVTAVGDLLGPTLENLGSLVKMPFGCGEQNMINFVPNIFILQYLEATNLTTPELSEKAIEYMKQGYQQELNYRHSDGSFSAFGSKDSSGSTWLTAFVLKSFALARQFIQIDSDDLRMSVDWVRRKQMENGCFESVGTVFHKDMKGGIQGNDSPVPLTSYALISLLEAGESSGRHISEAAFCLLAVDTQDPYTLALKAYALALARLPDAETVMQQLISQAVETNAAMYWELPAGASKSEGVAVETAGYAVLAMLTLNASRFDYQAKKIVKWISSKRNGQGGFVSTQDTVVALQALATFESKQDVATKDLVVTVEAGGLEHNFLINEDNKLLQQMVNLPTLPTNVILDMAGEGCAIVQAVLRYNIPDASPSEAFNLNVNTAAEPECKRKRIEACASYQLPDNTTNMGVIEINLVSGYIPEKSDLKQIVGYGAGLLKRYEVDGSKVTFYVDQFSSEEICVNFQMLREVDVEDVKPGTVKVYDYYQPEFSVTESYTLPLESEC